MTNLSSSSLVSQHTKKKRGGALYLTIFLTYNGWMNEKYYVSLYPNRQILLTKTLNL
jgi:hypothetical protein